MIIPIGTVIQPVRNQLPYTRKTLKIEFRSSVTIDAFINQYNTLFPNSSVKGQFGFWEFTPRFDWEFERGAIKAGYEGFIFPIKAVIL